MRLHLALRSCVFLLALAAPLATFGQFQAPIKDELSMTSDPKAPGADAVILYREEISDDPHHFSTVYARVKILTEKGLDAATVHVVYAHNFVFQASGDNSSRMGSGSANHWDAPDVNHAGEDMPNDTDSFNVRTDISAIEGRTIQPDGSIVPLTGKPADLLKVKRGRNQLNDTTFTLPAAQVGSVIEYRYQIRYDRFDRPPNWQLQQPYFIHREHFSFTPAEKFNPSRTKMGSAGVTDSALTDIHGQEMTDIRSSAMLPPHAEVKTEASGNYTIDLTDVPAIPHQPFQPPADGMAYRVDFFYTPTPDEKEFWQREMGYWMRSLTQYIAPTPALKSTVQELVAAGDPQLEKAKKIYSIVQKLENTDFTVSGEPGIGSEWIPAGHVEKVLQDKKGTSNQMAYLYLAMARIAGLDARPERIASRSRRLFSPSVLETGQLDSVVIDLKIDGKDITVDPGTKMAPFQTLHWAHAAAAGVALGSNGKVESVVTPAQQNSENTVLRVGTLAVTPQGSVSGTLKVAFVGQQAIELRQLGLTAGPDAVKTQINQLLARQVPQGIQAQVDHVAFLDDSSKQLLAIVPVSGTLATHAGTHLVLPRVFFDSREANPFPAESRVLPIDMRYPAQEQEQITYDLPAGFSVDGKPQDTVLKWEPNAAYQLRSKENGNSITNARVLARGFTLLDAKDYDPLRDFYQKVITADQQQLVLEGASANKGQ